eukprot:scaffold1315_cov359-Pinguiococcus_pyrenoidosus.AAC.6
MRAWVHAQEEKGIGGPGVSMSRGVQVARFVKDEQRLRGLPDVTRCCQMLPDAAGRSVPSACVSFCRRRESLPLGGEGRGGRRESSRNAKRSDKGSC